MRPRWFGPLDGLGSSWKRQKQATKIPLLDEVFIYNSKILGTLSQLYTETCNMKPVHPRRIFLFNHSKEDRKKQEQLILRALKNRPPFMHSEKHKVNSFFLNFNDKKWKRNMNIGFWLMFTLLGGHLVILWPPEAKL